MMRWFLMYAFCPKRERIICSSVDPSFVFQTLHSHIAILYESKWLFRKKNGRILLWWWHATRTKNGIILTIITPSQSACSSKLLIQLGRVLCKQVVFVFYAAKSFSPAVPSSLVFFFLFSKLLFLFYIFFNCACAFRLRICAFTAPPPPKIRQVTCAKYRKTADWF